MQEGAGGSGEDPDENAKEDPMLEEFWEEMVQGNVKTEDDQPPSHPSGTGATENAQDISRGRSPGRDAPPKEAINGRSRDKEDGKAACEDPPQGDAQAVADPSMYDALLGPSTYGVCALDDGAEAAPSVENAAPRKEEAKGNGQNKNGAIPSQRSHATPHSDIDEKDLVPIAFPAIPPTMGKECTAYVLRPFCRPRHLAYRKNSPNYVNDIWGGRWIAWMSESDARVVLACKKNECWQALVDCRRPKLSEDMRYATEVHPALQAGPSEVS